MADARRRELLVAAATRFAHEIANILDGAAEEPANDAAPTPKPRSRRRAVRAPAEPDAEVSDLDRARAKKMLAAMGIHR